MGRVAVYVLQRLVRPKHDLAHPDGPTRLRLSPRTGMLHTIYFYFYLYLYLYSYSYVSI